MLTTLDLATARRRLQQRRVAIMARYQAEAAAAHARRRARRTPGASGGGAPDLSWVRLLTDEDATRLLRIFEALRRIDLGSYGLCVVCGLAIDSERLRVEPEAHQCEVCATFSVRQLSG